MLIINTYKKTTYSSVNFTFINQIGLIACNCNNTVWIGALSLEFFHPLFCFTKCVAVCNVKYNDGCCCASIVHGCKTFESFLACLIMKGKTWYLFNKYGALWTRKHSINFFLSLSSEIEIHLKNKITTVLLWRAYNSGKLEHLNKH